MSAGPFVAATAIGVGGALPPLLARVRLLRRAPVAAVGLWLSLSAAFVIALALAIYQVVAPDRHGALPGFLGELLCTSDLAHGTEAADADAHGLLTFLPLVVAAWPLGWIAAAYARFDRTRRRHADLLAVTATWGPESLGAAVLDHDVAAAYCLPGRRPRVVVTSAAVAQLSHDQMRAVLAHEQAHIRGRHHLLAVCADGFALAFPMLPLARHAREQVRMLLEMAADDRALRQHRRVDLAHAMYKVAAGRIPPSAFGAGTGECLERMERLGNAAKPARAFGLGLSALALLTPVLPLLIACASDCA